MGLFGRETEADRQKAQEWADWVKQRNPLALISCVLGVFSLIEFGVIPIFSLGGLIVGIIALKQLRKPDAPQQLGKRLAWTGIILSGVAFLTGMSFYVHR